MTMLIAAYGPEGECLATAMTQLESAQMFAVKGLFMQ